MEKWPFLSIPNSTSQMSNKYFYDTFIIFRAMRSHKSYALIAKIFSLV